MPTFTQLEYIIAVERLRHFGKASKACHVSQPSLSAQIQKVEEELGIVIFDRLKKPILPTHKGKEFIQQAKRVLAEHHRLIDLAKRDSSIISGDFKLGIIPTLAPYLLPSFLDPFSKHYPNVNLQIDELRTEAIISELKEDRLDAGILATPLHEEGLFERVLFYEPFYLYLGKNHPLKEKNKITEDELNSTEMWLLQDGHCFRNQVIKLCTIRNEGGVFKNINFQGGNFETLRYLIQKTRGYTLFPELFVNTLSEAEKRASVREFTKPIPSREVSLVFRRNQWKADLLDAIEETFRSVLPRTLSASKSRKNERVIGIAGE